ncbi:MAG: phosphoribosylformylglycinamidine cyclo-ligase [Dehalococcoidales bacterium]
MAAADKLKRLIAECARTTLRPEVLAGPGLFGGLFELKGFKQAVLVSSVDGVGSKLKIASTLDRHDTIGVDLVNHCVNDILTCGAEPLFFLDYIAMDKLIPERVETIVRGIAKACSDVGCSLIGGETAEMPGLYTAEDYDLVGFIVGGVEKDKIINGSTISAGDAIVGLAASGLHTNGYALVRKIFGTSRKALNTLYPELGRTLGEELLEPHRLYYHQLKPVLNLIKGMAHITGGGIISNVPRVLPPGVAARIDTSSWSTPPIFRLIQQRGKVDRDEMYRVFNMGIGMVVICSPENADRLISKLPEANVIGKVEKQRNKTRVVID